MSRAKSNDIISPNYMYVPSIFPQTKSPVKTTLTSDLERHERTVETKKIWVENCDRLAAASSLLALSEDGNGVQYCEPRTGPYMLTYLSMNDVDKLKRECVHLRGETVQLKKCNWRHQRLTKEHNLVKEKLREECKHLQWTKCSRTSSRNNQLITKESLKTNNAKVKYYMGLP